MFVGPTLSIEQLTRHNEGTGAMARIAFGIVGWSLLFSAFGLWAMPGSDNVPELSLIKLGLSVFMLIGGLCCIVSTRAVR